MDPMIPALSFQDVSKVYSDAAGSSRAALRDVSFDIPRGRRVAVVGRSGSGKSTLLHLAAGIDVPTTGDVAIDGKSLGQATEEVRTRIRRDEVGLIFQFFHLMPHLSVFDNVALPALISGDRRVEYEPRITDLLRRVGMDDRAGDSVQHLSGGEMQRVAFCRALLRRPRLLLADEPTGNLDDATGQVVMEQMFDLAAEEETTLVYVTHSAEFAALADEQWELHSGELRR